MSMCVHVSVFVYIGTGAGDVHVSTHAHASMYSSIKTHTYMKIQA